MVTDVNDELKDVTLADTDELKDVTLATLELNDVETDELNVVIVVVTDELIVAIDDDTDAENDPVNVLIDEIELFALPVF